MGRMVTRHSGFSPHYPPVLLSQIKSCAFTQPVCRRLSAWPNFRPMESRGVDARVSTTCTSFPRSALVQSSSMPSCSSVALCLLVCARATHHMPVRALLSTQGRVPPPFASPCRYAVSCRPKLFYGLDFGMVLRAPALAQLLLRAELMLRGSRCTRPALSAAGSSAAQRPDQRGRGWLQRVRLCVGHGTANTLPL